MNRAVLQPIVDQHADDAAVIYGSRRRLLVAPHARLLHLGRFDNRLLAHLDGLREAASSGRRAAEAALDTASPAALFVATCLAIEDRDARFLNRLFMLAEALPEAACGLRSAFGWTSLRYLQELLPNFLGSSQRIRRHAAITAYAMHRSRPDSSPFTGEPDSDVTVAARTLRWAGEVGASDSLPALGSGGPSDDPEYAFWAAWAAVLLGDRHRALARMRDFSSAGPHRHRTLRLTLQVVSVKEGVEFLRTLAAKPEDKRTLIMGAGILGLSDHVPWLISQMKIDGTARLAGEAFTLISGVDLALADLERKPPEDFLAGPNDNPDDTNVEMDPDDGLPWPDVKKVEAWWQSNERRFQKGTRYFMGKPVTREHCIDVLKNGYQRQRILAAHYLCLLEPGTPLFNTSAPAWRQQRLLAAM